MLMGQTREKSSGETLVFAGNLVSPGLAQRDVVVSTEGGRMPNGGA